MNVRAATPEEYSWLLGRVGYTPTASFRALAAVDNTGRVRGMVGFDSWTENSAQAHFAVDTPMALRELAPAAFEYVFHQAGRGVLVGVVREDNARSRRATKHLGFKEAYRIRDGAAAGVALLLYELRREECRYLPQPVPSADVCKTTQHQEAA